MVSRHDRGQLLLVGAVAIAFLVLGVVVIFNGVLYTEAISAGGTATEARDVATTELEIERTAGCLLNRTDTEGQFEENVTAYASTYRNSTAGSGPTLVTVTSEGHNSSEAELRLEYDSNSVTYERTLQVEEDSCPDAERVKDP